MPPKPKPKQKPKQKSKKTHRVKKASFVWEKRGSTWYFRGKKNRLSNMHPFKGGDGTAEFHYQLGKVEPRDGNPATKELFLEAVKGGVVNTGAQARDLAHYLATPLKSKTWLHDNGRFGPCKIKKLAREWRYVVSVDPKLSKERKLELMRAAHRHRAEHDPEFVKTLLETGDDDLVEDREEDDLFGIGKDGKGENWQGKLLMELRTELKKKEE